MMIKIVFVVRKRDDVRREKFYQYWLESTDAWSWEFRLAANSPRQRGDPKFVVDLGEGCLLAGSRPLFRLQFNAKVEEYNYKFLCEKEMLASVHAEYSPEKACETDNGASACPAAGQMRICTFWRRLRAARSERRARRSIRGPLSTRIPKSCSRPKSIPTFSVANFSAHTSTGWPIATVPCPMRRLRSIRLSASS